MFIFGVATTVSVIHQKLPNHVSSYLPIEKFSGLKATEMLAHFIEKVVMDDGIGFKLGGKCLDMLLEIFLFCDFSVSRFIAGYKVQYNSSHAHGHDHYPCLSVLLAGTLLQLPSSSTAVHVRSLSASAERAVPLFRDAGPVPIVALIQAIR